MGFFCRNTIMFIPKFGFSVLGLLLLCSVVHSAWDYNPVRSDGCIVSPHESRRNTKITTPKTNLESWKEKYGSMTHIGYGNGNEFNWGADKYAIPSSDSPEEQRRVSFRG